jgi:hypothetical protein
VEWYFRDISDDPSEKELTQQDQFNNDEVALAEALVRETIQNSTDASANGGQVRVRFALRTISTSAKTSIIRQMVDGLAPNLMASELGLPRDRNSVRLLVIEDFGTTGLKGAVDVKDDGQFCGFWRRFGRSNKKEAQGGRWGLGKLVFPSASQVRAVVGLTRRADDASSWLMGQAILRNHQIGGIEKDSVGFWCDAKATRKGMPTNDPALCRAVSVETSLVRTREPGLSIVVPHVIPDIEPQHLMAAAVRNYYYPILTGRLVVEVDGTIIDATSFETVSTSLGSEVVPAWMVAFVRELQDRRESAPDVLLPGEWQSKTITGGLLGPDTTEQLREAFKVGQMLSVRAPLSIVPRGGPPIGSHVDLFLKAASPGERAQTLVVRGAITVPTEGKRATLMETHAALEARDDAVSRLLGDAENPAHTQWNERAERLRNGWQGGGMALRRVRAVLHELHAIVFDRLDREDTNALVDFFSIPKPTRRGKGADVVPGKPTDLPEARPHLFRVERKAGGFSILSNPTVRPEVFPLKLHVRCAYDVLSGNPFRRYSEYDFSFFSTDVEFVKVHADCWPTDFNEFDMAARQPEFRVDVVGFDQHRDIIVVVETED